MIINKLVFPIRSDGTFVGGAIPVAKLTANNINKDMFYVISPTVGATVVTATFQNNLQSEPPESMNMQVSSLKVSDLVRDTESYYDLIKDWNVWQAFMPSKVLSFVSYNRAGMIGISFNFRQVLTPHIVDVEYRGDISNENYIPIENGYYVIKTPYYTYDDIEFTFNDLLIKNYDEITIRKAILTTTNTATLNYSVDPSVFESEFEELDISLTQSVLHQTNENTTDIKILFDNQDGIYDDIDGVKDRLYVVETDLENIGGGSGNSYEPDGVTIVLNEDNELSVSKNLEIDGGTFI